MSEKITTSTDVLLDDADRIAELERRLAAAEVEIHKRPPLEMMDLVRFLANTWASVDQFVYDHCDGEALLKYPVVQGTKNQIYLKRIGQQPFVAQHVARAVEWILRSETTQIGGINQKETNSVHDAIAAGNGTLHGAIDYWQDINLRCAGTGPDHRAQRPENVVGLLPDQRRGSCKANGLSLVAPRTPPLHNPIRTIGIGSHDGGAADG